MAQSKKKAKRASGPSGKHLNPIRTLSGVSDEEWARWDEAAKAEDTTRVDFVRRAVGARADDVLRKK
jgi:hypothetical protein